MSLGFRILGEAESEISNLLTFLPLKAMDTSLVHGQSCSALLLHQVWWNSITNYAQLKPWEIRGAATCSTSACTVRIWIVMSQFSSTRGTADKDEYGEILSEILKWERARGGPELSLGSWAIQAGSQGEGGLPRWLLMLHLTLGGAVHSSLFTGWLLRCRKQQLSQHSNIFVFGLVFNVKDIL